MEKKIEKISEAMNKYHEPSKIVNKLGIDRMKELDELRCEVRFENGVLIQCFNGVVVLRTEFFNRSSITTLFWTRRILDYDVLFAFMYDDLTVNQYTDLVILAHVIIRIL